jgi:hypothetical protein
VRPCQTTLDIERGIIEESSRESACTTRAQNV